MRKWILRILVVLLILVVAGAAGFALWGINGYGPLPEATAAMQSDKDVQVTDTSSLISFAPAAKAATTGYIFYPGARVLPAAYAPYMHDIARNGYAVFVVKMPVNFAIFGIYRAQDVIDANPTIKNWAIGGHSLGGSMAAIFAEKPAIKGIVFWASYPANDLSRRTDLAVMSIFGSVDGLVKMASKDSSRALLPANAQTVTIEGSNHAFFGWYGAQDGDNAATISRDVARDQIESATITLLKQITT